MCGFAGLLNLSSEPLPEPSLVEGMSKLLNHRGPDDRGFYSNGPLAFGFRRLSIIDVAGGHQPVTNENGTVWCMLNGEVYNYLDLRHELEHHGHLFKTNSDTETVVHGYEQWGLGFANRLRGMFAVAIWDAEQRQLILARDRIGKKPLYYSVNRGQLAFASELKALLGWPALDRTVDPSALQDYLRFLFVPAPRTIFRSVRKLLPGHMITVRAATEELHFQRYWSFDMTPDRRRTKPEVVAELRQRLEEAVRIRLRSDVPLGAFLSGGLDSSSIVALMAREQLAEPPLTFSMGFPEADFDESPYALLVARSVGSNHHQELVEPVSPETLQLISWHLDEPFADSSAVPTYLVCKAARRHVTVALSGDGGDELFAGYNRYRYFRSIDRLAAWPPSVRKWARTLLSQASAGLTKAAPALGEPMRQALKALEGASLGCADRPFFLNQYFKPADIRQLVSPDLNALQNGRCFEEEWAQSFSANGIADGLDLFLYIDTVLGLPDDMLTKVDRMSMAHGLEVRCPLLDQEVVEYAGSIPTEWKLRGAHHKHILKEAVSDLLPNVILRRSKSGFGAPIGNWLSGTFRELTEDCLSPDSVSRRDWFIQPEVTSVRDSVLSRGSTGTASGLSKHQIWHRAWALLMLELWARRFLDQPLPASLETRPCEP